MKKIITYFLDNENSKVTFFIISNCRVDFLIDNYIKEQMIEAELFYEFFKEHPHLDSYSSAIKTPNNSTTFGFIGKAENKDIEDFKCNLIKILQIILSEKQFEKLEFSSNYSFPNTINNIENIVENIVNMENKKTLEKDLPVEINKRKVKI